MRQHGTTFATPWRGGQIRTGRTPVIINEIAGTAGALPSDMGNDNDTNIDEVDDFMSIFEMSPEEEDYYAARNAAESAAKEAQRVFEINNRCGRCNGTGHIAAFRHVAHGTCFACEGRGVR